MEKFEVTILGCGSAKPSTRHFPSAQIINFRDKLFLVDCGEGTQMQMCRNHVRFTRMNNIFISHLHGDHCFGLIGLLSSLELLGRTAEMHIYAPGQLEKILFNDIAFFNRGMSYKITFHPVDTEKNKLLYEDNSLQVYSVPLDHRVPCSGFLFVEKPVLPHIRKDMIDYYNIPYYAIKDIKEGADWILPSGEAVPSEKLTTPSYRPRIYAYCSDTAYSERLKDIIYGSNVLYHEATFADDLEALANERGHSTARQAATVARESNVGQLVIGHYSSRYEDESLLLEQAREVFPNTIAATEDLTIKIR